MSIKSIARHAVGKAAAAYREEQKRKRYENAIRTHIRKTTDIEIPALSAELKREAEAYWSERGIILSSTDWHRYYYARTGKIDPRFVPDDVFHRIIRPKMNDIKMAAAWSDKAYTDWVVRDVRTVESVLRCVNGRLLDRNFELIDRADADRIMNGYEALVLKPSMFTDTGKNVVLQHAPFAIDDIIARYGKYFVVQLPLRQHPDLALLNASSVNTIRIDTVLLDKEAHAIPAFVKAGQPGDFTDNGGGEKRIFIGIENGRYTDFAFDHDCNKFYSIPSGYAFAGQKVPFLDEICRAAEKAHTRVPHFGLAFWDMSVDVNGEPVIVEMNLRYPDSYVPQVAAGPFFGDYTEDVLKYIKRENQ